jgi:hypothetical protein
LCDESLVGWIKFNGDGEPPTRVQGLLYHGFIPPPRASLGDMDERDWPDGLSGGPEDPWKAQQCVVLQEPKTGSLFTFTTVSPTGRSGVTALLNHYNRLRKSDPNALPVIRMKPGGYMSKKFGWVHKPVFCVVGRTTKGSLAAPDTSTADDLNYSTPY